MLKAIGNKVKLAYSNLENSAQLCEVRDHARDLKQGNTDVTEYFTALTKIWQKLNKGLDEVRGKMPGTHLC